MQQFKDSILELIIQTSTNLPQDVREVLGRAGLAEPFKTKGAQGLEVIYQNVDTSCNESGAICQDTGMLTFDVHCPVNFDQVQLEKDIREAVAEATRKGKLRPNSVDSLTGKNTGDNLSASTPVVHFKQWQREEVFVRLIMKGGGCENMNAQYSLPCDLEHIGAAGRDLQGVKKCILHALWKAQGQGCSAGFLGVAVGSDRAMGYSYAKEQLFRPLDDQNEVPELAKLEQEIVEEGNKLGIGVMGFGGKTTILGCKVGVYHRLPASFFVSIAYNCWAYRRLGVYLDAKNGAIKDWYQLASKPVAMAKEAGFPLTGKETRLTTPLKEEDVRKLKVGDVVLLSGKIFTGRDALHKYLMSNNAPTDLQGQVIYHCGPVMLKDDEGAWHVQAAGPTTSSREEPYQATVLENFGVKAVIGKGGMGPKTSAGLQKSGAVYLHAIGGAAQVYAKCLTKVHNVYLLEQFGIPEAMWELECVDFPAIVTMDSHGGSLHADVLAQSAKALSEASA